MRRGLRSRVERGDEKDRVDVRRHDLLVDGASGRRARHGAAPIEPPVNDAALHADPVADRGKIGGAGRRRDGSGR